MCVCVFLLSVKGFDTEEQFEKFVRTDPHSENVLAAVVFEHLFTRDDEPLPLKVKGRKRPPETHPSDSSWEMTPEIKCLLSFLLQQPLFKAV